MADIAENYAIETPNTSVTLDCNNGSSHVTWTKINSTDVEVYLGNLKNLSVVSPQDQGKFVCHEGDRVHKIVYVYIPGMSTSRLDDEFHTHTYILLSPTHMCTHTYCDAGYLAIRIFYPPSNLATSLFTINTARVPMCNAHVPFPTSAVNDRLRLFVNSKRILRYHGDDVVANVDGYTVLAKVSPALDNFFLIFGFRFGITEEVVSDLRQQLEDQQYVCTFSNKWESISVTFNLTLRSAGILLVVLLYTYLYYNYPTCLMPGCTNIECTQFLCWCSC